MEPHREEEGVRSQSKLRSVKSPLWVTLLLLIGLVGAVAYIALSKGAAERRHESAMLELTTRSDAERAAALSAAQAAFTRHNEEAYRLFGTALAWSIRSALMRKNLDEIDQYLGELVQHERIRLALLADPDGNILVSTDRNFKGSPFGQHFPPSLLEHTTVAIQAGEGQMKRLVLPIQGLNERLGTVMVVYEAPPAGTS